MTWTCAGCDAKNPEGADFCTECGAANPGEATVNIAPEKPGEPKEKAPPPRPATPPSPPPAGGAPPAKKSSWGWIVGISLVVILGACLILSAIIAAIAIPNFLEAKERAKQKRTMADMRQIGQAIQSYRIDFNEYPQPGHGGDAYYALHEVFVLETFLVPDYIAQLPALDAWGNPYQYGISEDSTEFMLLSPGSDGESQLAEIPAEIVETHCYEDDILWENDDFLQMPVGKQSRCR